VNKRLHLTSLCALSNIGGYFKLPVVRIPTSATFSPVRIYLLPVFIINILLFSPGFQTKGWGQNQTFTTSGTFTVPAGVTQVTIECWGAGGGGGSRSTSGRAGGGGGGAYASSTIAVTPGNLYNVVVGSGGNANTAGGNSTFNSTTVVAAGGSGGTLNSTAAGAGGAIANSTGAILYAGGNGAAGGSSYSGGGGGGAGSSGTGGSASGATGGAGTPTNGGNGGAGVSGSQNGLPGSTYGGGGSGAVRTSGTRTGGSGADGLVVISWFSAPYYCIPTYSTGTSDGDFISLVQLGDINNSTSYLNSPYYYYYSNLTTNLLKNTNYTITLSAGTYASGNNITVWIDFNRNGTFESIEKLGNVTLGAAPATGTINFTVPADAITGTTRMRVREVYNNSNQDPCAAYTYGETEDYNVEIINCTVTITATATETCIGSSANTGSITAVGNNGSPPYMYSLNGGTYQASGTFTALAAGTYNVTVRDSHGCTTSTNVTVSDPSLSEDNQNLAGSNSWIGHVYDGTNQSVAWNGNFTNYYGNYTESETFDQNFGGSLNCFDFFSNSVARSIYTQTYSVRYRMNSTRNGLFVVDLGSDDGGRLAVDGTLVYNNWSDQAFSSRPRVLMSLNGASSLVYDFYENGGENRIVFQNLTQVLANTLSTNTTQNICLGSTGSSISGDTYGSLPSGISLSGTGYQWTYSTTPGGTRINIAGATSANYVPNSAAAPFNSPGTYYIYRNAILSSANNVAPNPYIATNESNAATITVQANVPASVSIAASANPVCAGTSVTFTATPTNGGTSPTYQWRLNGSNVGTNSPTYTNAALVNGNTVSCVMTSNAPCASGSPATSNTITMTVNPVLPASVSIAASANPICAGTSVTFTATPANGGTSPTYQWRLNGSNVGTNSPTYTNAALVNGNTVSCVMTSNAPCASGSPATSNTITMTVNPVLPASVSIVASANPVCAGTSVTFTATPTNGGTSPTYQWRLNGSNVGTNSPTYTNAALVNGNTVSCVMTSNAPCASGSPATSNTITMTVNPVLPANVSIAASANPICAGTSVTFTATPTNGGTSPTYQWRLNGANVGTNSPTYTNAALANGNTVSCVMTSNAPCAAGNPATSNTITMTVNPVLPANVSIAASANPICAGTSVTFTATPTNGGTSPTYQWRLNGANVGTNSPTYTNAALANGNTVSVVMTSNAPCASGSPATSNTITMTVNPVLPASVSIAASANPICAGTSVTFTATPVNGGTSPSYQWRLNGANVGTNSPTYTNAALANGNTVSVVMTSNAPCASGSPATSNTITMEVGQQIGNNILDPGFGVHGNVCATANENSNANVAAPAGSAFVHIVFASYGTPNGVCGAFIFGACHATTSFGVAENYLLGNNTAVIPATNGVFGDPCVGTVKRLYIEAVYAEPICAGSSPGEITGTLPTGGNGTFAYLWESSTTSASTGFAPAVGTNNQQNYAPEGLLETTWFRRTVFSGGCSHTSQVILIQVVPELTGNVISENQTICEGTSPLLLSGAVTGGGTGIYNYLWESSTTSAVAGYAPASGTNNGPDYQPSALTQTTWFRRTVTSGGCTDVSAPVEITVIPTPVQPGPINGESPVCEGSTQIYSVPAINGLSFNWTFPAGWEIVSGNTTQEVTVNVGAIGGSIQVVSSNSCGTSPARILNVVVNYMNAISLGPDPVVCPSALTAILTYEITAGNPNGYSIDFDAAANAVGINDVNNWGLSGGQITINLPWNAPTGVYNGVLTVFNFSGGCTSEPYLITVTIEDDEPPVFENCPDNFSIYVDGSCNAANAYWTAPTVSDNCGVQSFSPNLYPGAYLSVAGSPHTITYTATDYAGNVSVCSFLITVVRDLNDPIAVAASDVGTTMFTANWEPVEFATTYFLDVSTTEAFATFLSGFDNRNVGNTQSFLVSGLSPSQTYYYRVRANTSCSTSPNSNTISVITVLPADPIEVNASIGLGYLTYASLKLAFDNINNGTHQGEVTVKIHQSTNETAVAALNESGSGSANYTSVLIYPTSPGLTISGTFNGNPLINLNGADNVTFDGRVHATGSDKNLTIVNYSTSSNTSTSTIRLINSAENNIFRYCEVKGATTRSSSGIVFFSTASAGSGNNNNTISDCNLTGINSTDRPIYVVYSAGTASRENRGNSITDNNIFDHFRTGTTSGGISLAANTTDWTISGNSFYETTSPFSPAGTFSYYPVYVSNTSANGLIITGNFIGGSAPACSGDPLIISSASSSRFYGIYLSVGVATATSVQGNTIRNISLTTINTTPFYGIYVAAGAVNIGTEQGNILGSNTGTGSIEVINTAANASTYGMYITGAGSVEIKNNVVGSITTQSGAATAHSIYALYSAGTGNRVISNNLIGSEDTEFSINAAGSSTTSSAQIVRGIWNASSGNITIADNMVANMYNAYARLTSSGQILGIYTSNGINTIQNNIVRDLATSSPSTGTSTTAVSVAGIVESSALPGQAITGNTIFNLSNTCPTSRSVQMWGLYTGNTVNEGTNEVSGNFIHSLSLHADNSGTGAAIYGLNIGFTATDYNVVTARYFNNIISLGTGISNPCIIYGIYETGYGSGTSNTNNHFYFNTVYIGGNSSGNTLTNAFFNSSQGSNTTREFRNNIFHNARSSPSGSGIHYAIRIRGIIGATIDYNNYFADGTGGTLGRVYNTICNTLESWQTATLQDEHSLNTNPLFANASGTNAIDYYPNESTLIGVGGTGVLTDYLGTSRLIPTMGALERMAITKTWKGSNSTDFATGSNWTDGNVPLPGESILFDEVPLRHCILDSDRNLGSITNAQNTYRMVVNGYTLSINGNINFSNGAEIDATTAGSTVVFSGNTQQQIPENSFMNNQVQNLQINNSSNVVLSGTLNIGETLTAPAGRLDVISNAATLGFNGSSAQSLTASHLMDNRAFNLNISNTADAVLSDDLTVENTLSLSTGIFDISGTILSFVNGNTPLSRSSGLLAANAGTSLVFGLPGESGGNAFTLPNGLFTSDPEINNITINRDNPLTLGNQMISVRGIVLVSNGVLNTANNLTLLSRADQTALIDGSGNGEITGNVTMQRYLPNGFGYKYVSSPFQNASVGGFAAEIDLTADFPTFYRYEENRDATGWVTYVDPAGMLIPMAGYAANSGTSTVPKTLSLTAGVNNGAMAPVALYNRDKTYTKGFNLVGNPYPSPIDWDAVNGWTRSNIDNAIYYFDAGTTDQYTGTYSTYINGISSNGTATNVIASMQGFFVHVSDGAYPVSGSFGMDNRVRVNNLSPAFHKNTDDLYRPVIRLSAGFEESSSHSDPLVIYFDETATSGFENELDAIKLNNTDPGVPNFYALSEEGQRLSIGAWPTT
jgi:hypothetical protein